MDVGMLWNAQPWLLRAVICLLVTGLPAWAGEHAGERLFGPVRRR
jgi:hypothetical protein